MHYLLVLVFLFFVACGGDSSSPQESFSTPLQRALESGDASLVDEKTVLNALDTELQILQTPPTLLQTMYMNDIVQYKPTNNSQFIIFNGDPKLVFPIVYGSSGHTLAAAGYKDSTRVAFFGSNPIYFFQRDQEQEFIQPMKRLIHWLVEGSSVNESNKTLALSFVNNSSDVVQWLHDTMPEYNVVVCENITVHKQCVANADLIVQGSNADNADAQIIVENIDNALDHGSSFLYLHPNWGVNDTAQKIASYFDFVMPYGGNWWADDSAYWNNFTQMYQFYIQTIQYDSIQKIVHHFQKNDFHFNWSKCKDSSGNYTQDGTDCSDVEGLKSDFLDGAYKVQTMLRNLDKEKKDIFATKEYKLAKLLALLGDIYRTDVVYPMDKVKTDDNRFMRSYYSDFSVYNYRKINPAQKDMGNFSRSVFTNITPHNITINLQSKKYFSATGIYALPGITMKVTRTDESNVSTELFINTLRSAATHEYEKDGYKRPKFLQSVHFPIKPHETIYITSPYGGVVEIAYDKNAYETTFSFENIAQHPIWRSSADDEIFAQKMADGNFDWAEIVTDGFEVHSTLQKMQSSIDNILWTSAQNLARATQIYMSDYPHLLAGFVGEDIDVVDEIVSFAQEHNLTMATLDYAKHMNADQAACGYGCSGNPYDAYWAFSPVAHGDLHELGHGLEKEEFLFEGFERHATTNSYSYYSKSRFHQNTGIDPQCQALPFQEVFTRLQESVLEDNATRYLKENLWNGSNWSEQVLVTIEAMMHVQKEKKLQNGWHLLARLHILQRAIIWAQEDFQTRKHAIGFDNYTLDEFKNRRKNDWLLISYSFASGLDFRDYFDMMGIEYSSKAADQVASFGYVHVPKTFIVSTPDGYCKTDIYGVYLDKEEVPIDGTSSWPDE